MEIIKIEKYTDFVAVYWKLVAKYEGFGYFKTVQHFNGWDTYEIEFSGWDNYYDMENTTTVSLLINRKQKLVVFSSWHFTNLQWVSEKLNNNEPLEDLVIYQLNKDISFHDFDLLRQESDIEEF